VTTALSYRFDQGYPILRLFQVTLGPSLLLTTVGDVWHDHTVPGSAKAALLRELLESPSPAGEGTVTAGLAVGPGRWCRDFKFVHVFEPVPHHQPAWVHPRQGLRCISFLSCRTPDGLPAPRNRCCDS
jgi:hypothetical protein